MRSLRTLRTIALVAVSALAGAALATTMAGEDTAGGSPATPAPLGKAKYIVYLADGVLDPAEAVQPRGDYFQREIMKRTPEQIAQNKAEAVAFFRERFGLDFSSGDSIPGATLIASLYSPKMNYRAYTVSGESVPSTGWEVHDGGWLVMVGAGGTTLHGTWGGPEGKAVPEATTIPFGDYHIAVEGSDGSPRDPIVFHYQAIAPVPLRSGANPLFACELYSPEFGNGEAFAVIDMRPRPDGQVHMRIRNVLTFP